MASHCALLLHTLYEYALKGDFQQERRIALELYFFATGKINDEDSFYEARMAGFQEYFVFDYRLSQVFSGSSVFETFLYNAQRTFSLDELSSYEELRSFRSSLFQVEQVKKDTIVVSDLLSGRKFEVFSLAEYGFLGLDQKQIFEGRLFAFEGKYYFTGAFILHRNQVSLSIEKHVEKFLRGKSYCKADDSINWKQELLIRYDMLDKAAEQKALAQKSRQKSIDLLRLTKQIVEIPKKINAENLIMAIGQNEYVSPYVPETHFYNTTALLHKLSYCELRSFRYKHIDPIKIYDLVEDPRVDTAPALSIAS